MLPSNPTWRQLIRVVKYVTQVPGFGILMSVKKSNSFQAFCDVDWGSCINIMKSSTRYMIKFCDSLISQKFKKQSTLIEISTEAEYISLASSITEIIWLIGLFIELDGELQLPVCLHSDSKTVLQIAANLMVH